ncbi:MAG TPA: lysyl oxidase family protein [Polyangium sp.]|nr:lysyl oxidase family protein [Polyangium sp.]
MCNGKQCGDDGCGGNCGERASGSLCVTSTGQCQVFADCQHDAPKCLPACGAGEFCGSDCSCHEAAAAMPDLVLNKDRLSSEILFDSVDVSEASCSWIEQCVDCLGKRKMMRFSVEALNPGQATLTVPPPPERPDLFTFSDCHGHYHFLGFAAYSLLDKDGKTIATGRKQAYCMEDTEQIAFGPNIPCTKRYNCEEQGIQAGWSDLYGNTLDCQWLDVTDVPAGDYFLEVSLNPSHSFEEVSFTNTSARVPVTIP